MELFFSEAQDPTTWSVEKALQEVWNAPNPPEYIVMDRRTGEQYRIVSEELRLLREVCTPLGLKRIFPGIH